MAAKALLAVSVRLQPKLVVKRKKVIKIFLKRKRCILDDVNCRFTDTGLSSANVCNLYAGILTHRRGLDKDTEGLKQWAHKKINEPLVSAWIKFWTSNFGKIQAHRKLADDKLSN